MTDGLTISKRDPLRGFNFRIRFAAPTAAPASNTAPPSGPYIAAVRSVSGLSWTLSSYETWSGGNNMHPFTTPNRVSWTPITLEQGLAIDTSLEQWAEAGRALAMGVRASGARRTLQIDVWDAIHSGGLPTDDTNEAYSYLIYNAWVSKYNALPKLDATLSEVVLASVEISHEGWRRTPQSSQPSSPSPSP